MGNDTHKAVAVAEVCKSTERLRKGFGVKRAEAFINKHCVKLYAACGRLDFIRKTECKRKRCFERFAARKGFDASFRAVIVVDNRKVKTALTAVIIGGYRFFSAHTDHPTSS